MVGTRRGNNNAGNWTELRAVGLEKRFEQLEQKFGE